MPIQILVFLAFLGLACGAGAASNEAATDVPEDTLETTVLEVTVGAERVDCLGVAPRKCLVVDGLYFFDSIEGFDYEPGSSYVIRMERYDAWPGKDEAPQDASAYGYRLLEILKKVQEP